MTLEEVQAMSNRDFTNYGGDNEGYTGYADDFLDFAGKELSFANEISSKNTYTVTVINNTGNTESVILFPSYATLGAPAGLNILKDGLIAGAPGADLTGAGSPSKIKNFLDFVFLNPTNIAGMKVVSNVADQIAQKITIESKCPYRKLENSFIDLASFTSESNNNDKMVTVNQPFQVDNQTDVSVDIPASARTTFTFYIGATLNTAKSLTNKSERAGKHPLVQSVKAMAVRERR